MNNNNRLFEIAIIGCDTELRTSPIKENEIVIEMKCNQKFTMDYVMEILKELRGDKKFMENLHKQDLWDGCSIELEHRNKKFTLNFVDAIRFEEIIKGV